MPIEASVLKDAPLEAHKCPNCGHEPLELLMRGLVHRRKKKWPWSEPRPYCAVICSECKEVVAWEEPTREMWDKYHQEQVHGKARQYGKPETIIVDDQGQAKTAAEAVASSAAMYHSPGIEFTSCSSACSSAAMPKSHKGGACLDDFLL